jgi:exonuclease III
MLTNAQGLNSPAKQEDVNQIISSIKPDLVCLQETKLASFNGSLIRSILGFVYEDSFVFLPAINSRRGILIAAQDDVFSLHQSAQTKNTISTSVSDCINNNSWKITCVYGPQGGLEKRNFIRELRRLKPPSQTRWLLLGDFNLIYKDQDKNNGRLNRRLMNQLRCALNHLEVKEIDLVGKHFTWSSNQQNLTLTCIDRVFCTLGWEEYFFNLIV